MKIRVQNNSLLLIIYACLSSSVLASSIPEGFESHFKPQQTLMKFRNLDGSFSEPISLQSSFSTLQLEENNKEAIDKIINYLVENNIKPAYQKDIIDSLISGVHDKSLCLGKIEECELYPEEFEIVQNYNDQQVYLFVSPSVLSFSGQGKERKYHSSESKSNGLINTFDLYVSSYNDRDSIISLNDLAILGLPYGYVKTDFNLSNSEGASKLYEAAYHLDIDAYALKIGHFQYDPVLNSTDYLNNTARLSQNALTFGTSEKLLVGGQNSNKVLSFYVPSSGLVQVYRDDRIVYQENVSAGQNSISYSKLPNGRYEARVEVSSNGQVLNTQTYQVYNTANDSLAAGRIDYAISTGMFAESYFDDQDNHNEQLNDLKGDLYGKGLLNYQATPSWQLGAGSLFSEQGTMLTVGSNFSYIDAGLVAEAVYSQFDDASHFNANVGFPRLSISYENLDNENEDVLATHMYGYQDFTRWSVNSSYSFGQGKSLYAIYTKSNEVLLDNSGVIDEQDSGLLSLGYSSPAIFNSRLNVNFDYSDFDNSKSVNVLWSVPLSDTLETMTSVASDTESLNQIRTSVRKNDLIESDSFNTSFEVSNSYDRDLEDMYQEATLTSNGTTDYARLNVQAYASSRGSNRGINAGLSSTQIVTGKGVHITKDESEAFTLIDIEDITNTNSRSAEEKGYFRLDKDGRNSSKYVVYGDEKIVPLRSYHDYDASFDSQSVNLHNSGDTRSKMYSHPGAVNYISPKITRVVSFVSAFNNISDEPIKEIKCSGEGCLEVNEMTDGVYRVTVLEGLDFQLQSDQDQCLLPYEFRTTDQLNFGQNYCLPIANSDKIQKIELNDKQLNVVFLGAFEGSPQLKSTIKRLESLGYQIIEKEVGGYKAVYIAHVSTQKMERLAEHKKELESIQLLAKRLYRTNSITYPVASIY
ncbi:TcfC E-set like domain-containing protein [Vibrio jasicida]|uniref:TcfC E-set like domain-containing protein n=1 Tax=Vibrio jasicida TaxID=766224 RepID=UPI0040685A66